MGKQVHHQNLGFFCARMDEHTAVSNYRIVYSDEHYIFSLDLIKGESINVLLTDAYHFSVADILSMPQDVDYVVVVPNASYSREAEQVLKAKRIGIGHIREFMGAINTPKLWEHRTPEKRKAERKGN